MTQREKLIEIISDVCDGFKVEEVHSFSIKTKSCVKEFFDQHIEELKKDLIKTIQSLEE